MQGYHEEGKCDIAFINLPLEDDEVRFYGTVTHLNEVFVAGKKYTELDGIEIPLKRLQEFPLMTIEDRKSVV